MIDNDNLGKNKKHSETTNLFYKHLLIKVFNHIIYNVRVL